MDGFCKYDHSLYYRTIYGCFRDYNTDIWPIQIILYALALITVLYTIFKIKLKDRVNGFVLSFLWIWMGIIYHLTYFIDINKAASVWFLIYRSGWTICL